jgi:hypothetical protein
MQKRTRSILEELSSARLNKEDPEHFVESRAAHIIDSAINLVQYIREHFDEQTAYLLEKKLNSASGRFSRGVTKVRELKDVKESLKITEGDLQDEDD